MAVISAATDGCIRWVLRGMQDGGRGRRDEVIPPYGGGSYP
jgi:hypothetical protein